MANRTIKGSSADKANTVLERSVNKVQSSRRAKRLAQHQHWMKVMMEGQATPDLKYQKSKI